MDIITISNLLHFAALIVLVLLFACLWEARRRPDRIENFIDGMRPEIKRGEPTEQEQMVECLWTPDTPDACPYCNGAACYQCGPHPDNCHHDSFERHLAFNRSER